MARIKRNGSPQCPVCFVSFACLVLALALAITGCQPGNSSLASGERLSLRLRSASDDRRFTYFELTTTGLLSFAGGQEAAMREAQPVMTLTAEQLEHVRDIIQRNNLMGVPNPTRQNGAHVQYELKMQVQGTRGRTLRCDDEALPGVVELHDYLFSLQAEKRYRIPRLQ